METLTADLRYGLRLLRQNSGTTAVAVLTLSLGIGANTAIFSVVNNVLLKPLPYERPDELVMVWQDHTRIEGPATEWASPDNFFDWREQNGVFDGMFAIGGWGPTLSGVDRPEQLTGVVASYDVLEILGVSPALGRGFRAEEDRAGTELTVVISHALWHSRFSGARDVLGASIRLDGEPASIVGVLPPEVDLPLFPAPDVIAPLRIDRTNSCGRDCVTLRVVARLSAGVDLGRAREDMDTVAARLESQFPDANHGVGAHLVPLHEQLVGPVRSGLLLLLGAVGLVLLVACANVASLMLARAADREREVATRIAMGASRARLFRQLVTESLLLAGVGGFLGLVFALWGVDLLRAAIPSAMPRVADIVIDGRALMFTFATTVATGLVFGVLPAARASKPELRASLKEGGRGHIGGSQHFRSALIVAEVAIAVTLLVGAGLLTRSFIALMHVDPGFETRNILTAQLNLVGASYDEPPARTSFVTRLLEEVHAIPSVESAGAIYVLPLGGANADASFSIEGREPPPTGPGPVAWYRPATPDYFETMKVRLVRGRLVTPSDDAESAPVVLVNEAAVRRYWSGQDPLLSSVRIGSASRRVVGVVSDTKHFGLDQNTRPALYFPYDQLPLRFMNLVVRTAGEPERVADEVRRAVWDIDPGLAVARMRTMDAVVATTTAEPRVITFLLGAFALSAAALAAIGLYGVLSFTVRQRTREIGIRMALGARASDVLWWTVVSGAVLVALGSAAGLVAAALLTRAIESLLFGVASIDWVSFLAAPGLLLVVGLVASYVPAKRAANVDPITALRYE